MYAIYDEDLEIQIQRLINDLAFIDKKYDEQENLLIKGLIAEGVFFPPHVVTGVYHIFKHIMPDIKNFKSEICSIYSQKAYELGYLEIEKSFSTTEIQSLVSRILDGEFSKEYTPEKLLEKLPNSSFVAGNTVFCYADKDVAKQWVYFDFSARFENDKRHDYLRSIRWPSKTFEDGFELTQEGYEETRRGIANPSVDTNLFISQWKEGKTWSVGESLPITKQEPRESRWKHLWQ